MASTCAHTEMAFPQGEEEDVRMMAGRMWPPLSATCKRRWEA